MCSSDLEMPQCVRDQLAPFLDNSSEIIDCSNKIAYPFFGQLILDCLNRTEQAMSQTHIFLAAELSMQAQALAEQLAREENNT